MKAANDIYRNGFSIRAWGWPIEVPDPFGIQGKAVGPYGPYFEPRVDSSLGHGIEGQLFFQREPNEGENVIVSF